MNFLYVGQLWKGGTCLARADALRQLGATLVGFDVSPYYDRGARLKQRIQHRLLAGHDVSALNRDLLAATSAAGQVDVVWLDKARWVHPTTIEKLRARTGAFIVHYTPDPAFLFHHSRHFTRSVPLVDLCVTTKSYEVGLYQSAGARRVVLTAQGVTVSDYDKIPLVAPGAMTRRGAIFIGHHEPHYQQVLTALAEACPELEVHGPGWQGREMAASLRKAVRSNGLWGSAYSETLGKARIGIGLLSKRCPDKTTTRSFEIPASGCVLVAERTEEHQGLFREGSEAEFFSSNEELVCKVRHYLEFPENCIRVASAGRSKVLTSYGWDQVLAPVLHAIHGRG